MKFSVDPVQVLLHGAFGKAHFQGDFPVAEAGGRKFYGLPLIVGEQAGRRSSSLLASSKRSVSRRIFSMKGWRAGERSCRKAAGSRLHFLQKERLSVFLTDGESRPAVGQGLFIVTQLIKSSGELDFQIERAEQVGINGKTPAKVGLHGDEP